MSRSSAIELDIFGEKRSLTLGLVGRHVAIDACAAIAAAHAAGASIDQAIAGVARAKPPPMRGEIVDVAGRHVIVDCYNANPASMAAALRALAERTGKAATRSGTTKRGFSAPSAHDLAEPPHTAAHTIDAVITSDDSATVAGTIDHEPTTRGIGIVAANLLAGTAAVAGTTAVDRGSAGNATADDRAPARVEDPAPARADHVLRAPRERASTETGVGVVSAVVGETTARGVGVTRRGIAVLGDMLELGEHAPQAHREVGELARDLGLGVIALGDFGKIVADAADGEVAPDPTAAAARAFARTQPGDWILLKASRGMRLERVLAAMTPKDRV